MIVLRADERALATAVTAASATLLAGCRIIDASLGMVAAAGCIAIVLAALSPIGGIGAVVLTLPWFFEPIAVGTSEFPASELLLGAALAGAALRVTLTSVRMRGEGPFDLTCVLSRLQCARLWLTAWAIALVGLLLLLWLHERTDRAAAVREWRWTLLEPALLVTLATALRFSTWAPRYFAACLVSATAAAALAGLFDLRSEGGVVAEGVRRVSGPYPHPNALALFLVRGWAASVVWWALDPQLRRWLAIPVVISSLGLLATFSRGAFAASAIVVALLAAVAAPRLRIIALATVAACAVVLVAGASARMLDAFDGGSASLRLDIWRAALAMIRDRPVVGYGPDGFLYSYAPRYVQPAAWAERFTAHAHNLLLDFWVRLGIIGAAFVSLAVGACLASVVGFLRGSDRRATIGVVGLIGLFAAILHGMVDNAYFAHDLAMSAWLLAWLATERRAGIVMEGSVAVARPGRRRFGLHRITPV